jgi:hypothetical protein
MAEKNVTYSLATINNPNINGVKELTAEEFEKHLGTINKLFKESLNESLYKIVELNYEELKGRKEKYISDYPHSLIDMYAFQDVFIDLNRQVLNLLSSMRTYLDHTETRLKREFGDKSDEVSEFKKLTGEAFDSSFSYSFLEKLRNYAQHCGLPAGQIQVVSKGDEEDKTVNTMTLILERDDLLKNFVWTPKKVKENLLKQDETFDLFPLVDEKIETLRNINSKISGKYYLGIKDEAEELLQLILETEGKNGIPILLKISGDLDKPTIEKMEFPYKEIEKITNFKLIFNYGANPGGSNKVEHY